MRKILCKLILIITTLFILFYTNEINTWADTYTVVPGSTATLDTGKNVNAKIKSLVTPSATYSTSDTTITSIEWTNVAPANGVTYKNLSISGSDVLVYLDDTIVKVYTTAETIYLNSSSSYMFYYFKVIETLPITKSRLNTSNVTNFSQMFYFCNKLTSLDLSTWNVSKVTTFYQMFYSCTKLTTLDLSGWQVTNKCTNLSSMFNQCSNLETLTCDFNSWDVSNGINFSAMFSNCSKITILNLNNWQITNKCTYLSQMFYGCNNLKTLQCNFNTWDVSNVTSFFGMFCDCKKLPSLNLSTWNVSNGTTLSYMFYYCEKLTSLNLSNWKVTNKCTDLSNMFYKCTNLKTLTCNFNSWNVSKVSYFNDMFNGCILIELDISEWKIKKTANIDKMLYGKFNKLKAFNTYGISKNISLGYYMILDNNADGISDDGIKYAKLIKDTNSINKQIYALKNYELTLNYNGGTYNGESSKVIYGSSKILSEIPDGIIPIPSKANSATFLGYYTQPKGGELVNTKIIPSGNVTYYAHWESTEFTIYLHSNDLLNSEDEYVNDSKVIELTINVNNPSDLVSKLLPAIQELKNDGYLHDDGYLVTDMLYSGTLPSDRINLNEMSIRNDTTN